MTHAFLSLLLGFGMCVLVPLGIVGGLVWVATKRARDRHEERMAMIAQGLIPPDPPAGTGRAGAAVETDRVRPRRDPHRRVGWAVGILVGGVLWLLSDRLDLNGFGILLTAIGAAYVTRGVLAMRGDDGIREGDVT